MSLSSSRRSFFLICGLIFTANILVMNDVATIWEGAESAFLQAAHFDSALPLGTPAHLVSDLIAETPVHAFWVRLPGVLLLLLTLIAIYWLSNPVLGPRAARWTILVLGSSFLVPNLAKVATVDIWIFSWHALGFLILLRFLKQPRTSWRFSFYLFLALGIWSSPLSTILLFVIAPAILYWWHPQGNRIWRLQPWIAMLLIGAVLHSVGVLDWTNQAQYLAPFSGGFYLYALLGMLPFLGFLLGGLWEMTVKLRRSEELALLNVSLLAGALVAQSPVLQLVLALLVAKHFHVYFQKNYPFRGVVRTGAILHLLLVFLLATFLMMGGFFRFEAVGFRSALGFGAVYWVLSFAGVLGLFSGNRRHVWGGMIASGLLPVLLFWLQLYPLIESRRDVPKRLVDGLTELRNEEDLPVYLIPGGPWPQSNEVVYLKSTYDSLQQVERVGEKGNGIYIAPVAKTDAIPPLVRDSTLISGWNDQFRKTEWVLFHYRSGTLEDQIEHTE